MRKLGRTRFSALVLAAGLACSACSEKFQAGEGSPVEAGTSGAGGTTSDAGPGGATNTAGAGGRDAGTGAKGAGGSGGRSTGGAGAAPSGGRDGSAGTGATGDAGEADGGDAGPAESGYRRAVLDGKPLVYWRMGTTRGSSVPDETGGGNELVLQGTGHKRGVGGAIRGDDDAAIEFDGAASFAIATVPRVLDFVGNAPFTLECWARRSSGGASYFQHLLSNIEGSADRKSTRLNSSHRL